nr:hypothetical protein RNT25_01901 [arsenite-oxidising bacterium NT-25]
MGEVFIQSATMCAERICRMTSTKIITIAKLVEYAFASPQRRASIIENALTPPVFILDTKYPEIEKAACHFLASHCSSDVRLVELDEQFKRQEVHTNHQEDRIFNAHDAIAHTREMKWPTEAELQLTPNLPKDFEIEGISVRVKPNVVAIQAKKGLKERSIGVVKPYYSRSFPLHSGTDAERGVLFATAIHWYVEQQLDHLGAADPGICFVGDVFSRRVHFGAPRFTQRRKQLTSIAQEIADRWEPIRLRKLSILEKVATRRS